MTVKKKKKESLYRIIFNALIGENFIQHSIYLFFGMLLGIIGFSMLNTLPDIVDVVDGQILAALSLIYIGLYVYVCVKHALGLLPLFCYLGVAFEHLWGWNLYGLSFYLIIPIVIFALVDNLVVHLQRRKKK